MSTKRKSRGAALVQQLGGHVDAADHPCKAVRMEQSPQKEQQRQQSSGLLFSSIEVANEAPIAALGSHFDAQRNAGEESAATVIELNYEQSRLLKAFQLLELVLATLRARRQIATFARIQDGMERLTRQPFAMENLQDIVAACSDLFSLRWMKDATGNDFSLCVALRAAPQGSSRSELFAERLQALSQDEMAAFSLPEKPEIMKREETAHKINPLRDIRSQKGTSLEELRQNAARREQRMQELNFTQSTCEASQQEQRIRSLPDMLDCIHSHFLIAKRTQQPVTKVVAAITQQQRLGKISRSEAKSQLQLLVSLIPKFLSVLAADRDHSQQVLRLNLSCPYSVIRRQLVEAVELHVQSSNTALR